MRSPGVEGSQRELEVCSLQSPSSVLAEMPQTSCCAGDRGVYRGNIVPLGCWMGGRGGRVPACNCFLFHGEVAPHCSNAQLYSLKLSHQ